MRLIDADELLEVFTHGAEISADCYRQEDTDVTLEDIVFDYGEISDYIHNATTIDAEEVVRCKDCKYASTGLLGSARTCDDTGKGVGLYDYCSYGERKDSD